MEFFQMLDLFFDFGPDNLGSLRIRKADFGPHLHLLTPVSRHQYILLARAQTEAFAGLGRSSGWLGSPSTRVPSSTIEASRAAMSSRRLVSPSMRSLKKSGSSVARARS